MKMMSSMQRDAKEKTPIAENVLEEVPDVKRTAPLQLEWMALGSSGWMVEPLPDGATQMAHR